MSGTLYLIPTPLWKGTERHGLPEHTLQTIRSIRCFVVEHPTRALGFLKWAGHPVPEHERVHRVLNKRTPDHEAYSLVGLLREGDVGYFSEAGAPGVADPGAVLVRFAHQAGHKVVPLVGPSSIVLALMASGMNGQLFQFHGYAPVDSGPRCEKIRALERESAKTGQTQILIETPHRTVALARDILNTCAGSTRFCMAAALCSPGEWIRSAPVSEWAGVDVETVKGLPAVYLLQAYTG